MPVPADSDLKTVAIVVTKEQDRRIRARRDSLTTPLRRVSLSDVYREVIERGLEALSRPSNMISETSSEKDAA